MRRKCELGHEKMQLNQSTAAKRQNVFPNNQQQQYGQTFTDRDGVRKDVAYFFITNFLMVLMNIPSKLAVAFALFIAFY